MFVKSAVKVLDSGFFVSGTWNPDSSSCIPDSKAQEPDLGFPTSKMFQAFRIRISLHRAIKMSVNR